MREPSLPDRTNVYKNRRSFKNIDRKIQTIAPVPAKLEAKLGCEGNVARESEDDFACPHRSH